MRRAWVLLAVGALAAGCHRATTHDQAPPAVSSAAAVAASAAAANAVADRALARGDRDAARTALQGLLAAVEGAGASPLAPPDRRALTADARFRLATLELGAGRPREALAHAERGVALGGDDVFAANLLVALGKAREAAGDDRGAAEAYGRALSLNERLMQDALGSPDASP